MSGPPLTDPEKLLQRVLETGREVKFATGVVGKTTRAVLALLAIWAVVVWRLGPSIVQDVALIIGGVIATGIFVWWTRATQDFAERNPAQAMMDGAQFLEYQKFEAAIKGGVDPELLVGQGEVEPRRLT